LVPTVKPEKGGYIWCNLLESKVKSCRNHESKVAAHDERSKNHRLRGRRLHVSSARQTGKITTHLSTSDGEGTSRLLHVPKKKSV
jgi:hypothetical protein